MTKETLTMVKKYVEESPKLQELKDVYTRKCEELFGKIEEESADMTAFRELVLEAMAESPEAMEALRQVLMEHKKKRDEKTVEPYEDLVIDNEGKLTHKEDIFSGENQ